jgi:hypothetical protein
MHLLVVLLYYYYYYHCSTEVLSQRISHSFIFRVLLMHKKHKMVKYGNKEDSLFSQAPCFRSGVS